MVEGESNKGEGPSQRSVHGMSPIRDVDDVKKPKDEASSVEEKEQISRRRGSGSSRHRSVAPPPRGFRKPALAAAAAAQSGAAVDDKQRPSDEVAAAPAASQAMQIDADPIEELNRDAESDDQESAIARLTSTVLSVCKGEETIENAIQQMDISQMTAWAIGQRVYTTVHQFPQADTWEEVRENMMNNVDTMESRERVIPKAERRLFELLLAIQNSVNPNLATFDSFYKFRDPLFEKSIKTADVTRIIRLIFSALVLFERSDEISTKEKGRDLFSLLLERQSSQAVCQSLTYLLCQSQTASLASEILKMELDDEKNGGRLISMHMNNEDAEVLQWAIDKFADESCKTKAYVALGTPATSEMVERWWRSDMELVKRVRYQRQAGTFTQSNCMVFNEFTNKLKNRMSLLLSPQFQIDGLDRVKLLVHLDASGINELDRATSSPIAYSQFDDSDARVVVLKLSIAEYTLRDFGHLNNKMCNDGQREALRLHLDSLSKKANAILRRKYSAMRTSQSTTPLYCCLSYLRKWDSMAERLIKSDFLGTPSTSN
ncbi:hypothetical protein PENTCL1PPCAC_20200 [Pristionchus entomophagus]|uniref:Uncharacterized protein n=1 Tax=Pristionchus entomophagus TaxID=358040 RepID=A0AAV5TUS8_9BILA|nr:hypothetical protein PENTCL1PPCAC_20200 [Pristionchus entomophagus]